MTLPHIVCLLSIQDATILAEPENLGYTIIILNWITNFYLTILFNKSKVTTRCNQNIFATERNIAVLWFQTSILDLYDKK